MKEIQNVGRKVLGSFTLSESEFLSLLSMNNMSFYFNIMEPVATSHEKGSKLRLPLLHLKMLVCFHDVKHHANSLACKFTNLKNEARV